MEITEDFRLKHSWDMILCIEDFIHCIDINKKDLQSPRNIKLINFMRIICDNKNFNPAGVLKDYIYLEANSFFQYAKKLKDKKDMPELPVYLRDLRDFRDKIVGHKDYKEKIKSTQDWITEQQKINKIIPIPQLIQDVDSYYKEFLRNNL